MGRGGQGPAAVIETSFSSVSQTAPGQVAPIWTSGHGQCNTALKSAASHAATGQAKRCRAAVLTGHAAGVEYVDGWPLGK